MPCRIERASLSFAAGTPDTMIVCGRAGIGLAHSRAGDPGLLKVLLNPRHIPVRRGRDRLGNVNLQHQVSAAFEVKPQVDSILDRLRQSAVRYAHNAETEDHQYRYDECRFPGQILAHDLY